MNKEKLISSLEGIIKELKSEGNQELKDIYFEQYDKIADLELRQLCKNVFDISIQEKDDVPTTLEDAICAGFAWDKTPQSKSFWENISYRDDLETNPYIISKWKPEWNKIVYIPDLSTKRMFRSYLWNNDDSENESGLLKNNQVCRTPGEAIKKAEKMLNAIK